MSEGEEESDIVKVRERRGREVSNRETERVKERK